MKQNYFQHDNQFYQPNTGIAMGSPISSTLAEEETHMKHCLEHKSIVNSKRYVDDHSLFLIKEKQAVKRLLTSSTK
jgi:hypothetical protein